MSTLFACYLSLFILWSAGRIWTSQQWGRTRRAAVEHLSNQLSVRTMLMSQRGGGRSNWKKWTEPNCSELAWIGPFYVILKLYMSQNEFSGISQSKSISTTQNTTVFRRKIWTNLNWPKLTWNLYVILKLKFHKKRNLYRLN